MLGQIKASESFRKNHRNSTILDMTNQKIKNITKGYFILMEILSANALQYQFFDTTIHIHALTSNPRT